MTGATAGETGVSLRAVAAELAGSGLVLRGGFVFADEAAPPGPNGKPARAVLLAGQVGASVWPHFVRWRERQADEIAHPLDSWSREVIGDVARRFEARAVFPSDKPYLPFQQWAMRAEGLRPSPLGILIHPEYGLWHAYRGALLFEAELAELGATGGPSQTPIHLCDTCSDRPCLSACPVGAYSEEGFDYQGCLGHLRSGAGEACMTGGCLARNACPYGRAYRYPAEAQAHHQRYFAGS